MTQIIGRKTQIKLLNNYIKSPEPELIVLYGRRRIGKTHLVRTCFQKYDLYFEFTGIRKASMDRQITAFMDVISNVLFGGIKLAKPSSWMAALSFLNEELIKHKRKKIILFFDELPWMVTPRSGFMQEFEYCWNRFWGQQNNIKIILCGSAASWMLENIINAKGGLHNRMTHRMLLEPFNLATTKLFLENLGCKFKLHQILELYMITGGVPYYLKQIQKSKSIAQNIQMLCFEKNGALYDEFERLFLSLYDHAETNLDIIRTLASKPNGKTRDQLISQTKLASGGTLNKRLNELEAAGFIQKFIPYGKKTRDSFYKIIDEFCLFYLRWIEPVKKLGYGVAKGYWQTQNLSSVWKSWSGYAFESVCFKHIEQIRNALELQHTGIRFGSWQYTPFKGENKHGAQIDLLFDRDDNIITLFEIKYTQKPFVIDKSYAKTLINKIDLFEERTKTKKQLVLALVTANGLKENMYSEDLVQQAVTSEALFN